MSSENIKSYVIKCLKSGFSKRAVHASISNAGWPEKEIENIFNDEEIRSLLKEKGEAVSDVNDVRRDSQDFGGMDEGLASGVTEGSESGGVAISPPPPRLCKENTDLSLNENGRKVSPELKDYVISELKEGSEVRSLRSELVNVGWPIGEINRVFEDREVKTFLKEKSIPPKEGIINEPISDITYEGREEVGHEVEKPIDQEDAKPKIEQVEDTKVHPDDPRHTTKEMGRKRDPYADLFKDDPGDEPAGSGYSEASEPEVTAHPIDPYGDLKEEPSSPEPDSIGFSEASGSDETVKLRKVNQGSVADSEVDQKAESDIGTDKEGNIPFMEIERPDQGEVDPGVGGEKKGAEDRPEDIFESAVGGITFERGYRENEIDLELDKKTEDVKVAPTIEKAENGNEEKELPEIAVNPLLRTYILDNLKKGFNPRMIRSVANNAGWSEVEIERAFSDEGVRDFISGSVSVPSEALKTKPYQDDDLKEPKIADSPKQNVVYREPIANRSTDAERSSQVDNDTSIPEGERGDSLGSSSGREDDKKPSSSLFDKNNSESGNTSQETIKTTRPRDPYGDLKEEPSSPETAPIVRPEASEPEVTTRPRDPYGDLKEEPSRPELTESASLGHGAKDGGSDQNEVPHSETEPSSQKIGREDKAVKHWDIPSNTKSRSTPKTEADSGRSDPYGAYSEEEIVPPEGRNIVSGDGQDMKPNERMSKRSISNPTSFFIEDTSVGPGLDREREDQKKTEKNEYEQELRGNSRPDVIDGAGPPPEIGDAEAEMVQRGSLFSLFVWGVIGIFLIGAGIYIAVWFLSGDSRIVSDIFGEREIDSDEGLNELDPSNEREIARRMDRVRAFTSLYYLETGTYSGACSIEQIEGIFNVMESDFETRTKCNDSAGGFAAGAALSDNEWYCVDMRGFVIVRASDNEFLAEGEVECERI